MAALTRRIERLEGVSSEKGNSVGLLIVASGGVLALDPDSCVQILRDCGFLSRATGVQLANLLDIPGGLDADELKRFLRKHGAEICGLKDKLRNSHQPDGAS